MRTGHILAVDDDDRLRDLLKRYLTREGHDVTVAKDAASARKLMSSMTFDLVILDVMMPGEDGLSLLKTMREQRSETPVIILTARGLAAERIEGLKLGADDYLPKPFEPEELALRITSVLKRLTPDTPVEEIKLSGMIFHVAKGELRKDGRLVRLTESENAAAVDPRRPRRRPNLAPRTCRADLRRRRALGRRAGHASPPQDRARPARARPPADRARRRLPADGRLTCACAITRHAVTTPGTF
jgi:CheY-like chemotaxis protein